MSHRVRSARLPPKARSKRRSAREMACTAYHEAGHAVVAIHFGLVVESISIEQKNDILGHVVWSGREDRDPSASDRPSMRRTWDDGGARHANPRCQL